MEGTYLMIGSKRFGIFTKYPSYLSSGMSLLSYISSTILQNISAFNDSGGFHLALQISRIS